MRQPAASYDRYERDQATFERRLSPNEPAWLRDLRRRGLEAFSALGFPTGTRGNERWKYTNVGPLARTTFGYASALNSSGVNESIIRDIAPWHEDWSRLVFIDGAFSPALSSHQTGGKSIHVANLPDAASRNGVAPEEHLGQYADVGEDGFTALNTAFMQDGAFVNVPDETSSGAPLHLLFVSTGRDAPTVSHPRSLIVVGRNSRLTILESYVGLPGASYFTNAVAEIVGKEGSEIEHLRYMMESPSAFHIGATRVTLERDSSYVSTSMAKGARIARNDLSVLLDAPGSSCDLKGLYFTSGSQHIDNHIDIDHAKPNSSSNQLFKGILAGRSRAVFSGRVLVRKDAQKTFARQSDKNLLLSQRARINTKPSLEIFADDVQCFHGATAGAVAEEALFYMRSRGLDEDTARRLLIAGFAGEIIDSIRLGPLREHMERMFSGDAFEIGALAAAS
jgi:Fe-S cluster assembly protein SufD